MAYITFWDIDSKFDMQDWMLKTAESKKCSKATWQCGRVVELVFRFV